MRRSPTLDQRTSGILLHPTSLPGPHGSGDLGPAAYAFADWLAEAGQSWWQVLPVVPPAGGNSPYQSTSAFAGSPMLISLELLAAQGLLGDADLEGGPGGNRVDFGAAGAFREERLRRAFDAFRNRAEGHEPFLKFCDDERAWLDDYALFCALKGQFNHAAWTDWDAPLRARHPDALAEARERLRGEVRYHQFVQYEFARQWQALRAHCESLGLGLFGDLPIFVAHDSADVWARPDEYFLREDGKPSVVAGVPPDYFSATGQRWGNALYRWDVHKSRGYAWWVARLASMFKKFHAVRIDHFIGFDRYWEIDADCETAVKGRYLPGPGAHFFEVLGGALGGKRLPIVAEDLGIVTPEVKALRERFKLPGMRVLMFSFGTDQGARDYWPHTIGPDVITYTGTHDNDTSRGWFEELTAKMNAGDGEAAKQRAFVLRYLDSDGTRVHWDLLRLAWQSAGIMAVAPVQDLLGLPTDARMNTPGTAENNWTWRLEAGALTAELASELRQLTETYGRDRPA
ncbi:MAG TPA: 4-alpha-glucanotransferase [Polyangiaceae bacterium]|nr:4-alpha-glucanotransferase [Polyangiaceae bacterium]